MKNIRKLVLFNNGNNGDIHFSREFVKFFAKYAKTQIGVECAYTHTKCPSLLSDIDIPYESINCWPIHHAPFYLVDDVLLINTWIGKENYKWLNFSLPAGCTLSNNIEMFLDTIKSLNLELKLLPTLDYIPSIDYSKHLDTSKVYLKKDKNIFVSNGNVMSGQATNFDFYNIVNSLAEKHPSCNFFVTEKINTDKNNIIDANSIFKINPTEKSNLNELSFVSTFCDIIVGRASGPFCFCITKENLLNQNKTFLSFCNSFAEGNWAEVKDAQLHAKQLWNNTELGSEPIIFNMIDAEINEKFGSR